MELREYKNRNGKTVSVVRLTTDEDMINAYHTYFSNDPNYSLIDNQLVKKDKTVALGDYLVIDGSRVFTEVDGMFRKTYYPASFSEEEEYRWKICPTLILMKNDTAEEAIEELRRRGV